MTSRNSAMQWAGGILIVMLAVWLLCLQGSPSSGPSVSEIDALSQKRDAVSLRRLVRIPENAFDPFETVRIGGAYDVGKYGWRAIALPSPSGGTENIVIGTSLTSEDIGEIVLKREGSRLTYVPETDTLGVKIESHDLDIKFDIPSKRAILKDRLTVTTSGSGDWLFRLSPNYRVNRITDEKGVTVPFRQAGGVVRVPRPSASKAVYEISYEAVVNLPQYAGSITEREATLVNDYWYPMVGRQPAPYHLTVRAPKGWTTVGQGVKVSEAEDAGSTVSKFRMDLPVIYYSVLSAPMKSATGQVNGKTYHTWSSRLSPEQLRRQIDLYAPIVEFYEKSFGPWPFAGYGAVDSLQYGGGALEAYSFATWGGGLPMEDAHEPAHTYWGGVINNTYLKSFWNESFAVFSEGLYLREVSIGNVEERRKAYVQEAAATPVYKEAPLHRSGAYIGPPASSLGYGKGGLVLQMLEQWLGTEAMVGAMREWVAKHPKGEPGEWEDFEAVVTRRHPGLPIKGFFDDWVRRPGYAEIDPKVSFQPGKVSIDLGFKGPAFRMPMTVMLRNDDGSERFVDLWVDGTSVTIPVEKKPVLVSVDPWRRMLRPISSEERPVGLSNVLGAMRKRVHPASAQWLGNVGGRAESWSEPTSLQGLFLVGSPSASPSIQRLCKLAGFEVAGSKLTYRGTTIDLNEGAAIAVLDLPEGGRAAVGLGKIEHTPDFGSARLVVTDRLGRFLRGVTDPKSSGPLTYRL